MGESLNNIFSIVALAIGIFALLLEWTYVLEARRGIYIVDFREYHHYVNATYWMSMVIFLVLWFTVRELDVVLVWMFVGFAAMWFITALVTLVLSIFSRSAVKENRAVMRKVLLPCIVKTVIYMTGLWLIY